MSALHGRPTLDELLESVREFLADELAPVIAAEHAFHLRVAVNVLDIARRELALAPTQEQAHTDRLSSLGFADDRELADAIRSGATTGEKVRAAVLADVHARLAVANPRYLTSAPAQGDHPR